MQNTADIVVIGGGAIGCSTAYHLAQLNVSNIVVVEMNGIGSGSSSKTASVFTLHLANELGLRLGLLANEQFFSLVDRYGDDLGIRKIGFIGVATEETAQFLSQTIGMLDSAGVKVSQLDQIALASLYPEVNCRDVVLASWAPDDFIFDPHMLIQLYVQKARERGVVFMEDTVATGILVGQGRIRGVATNRGIISTGTVVNAAGPWASVVGEWTGTKIPLVNRSRSIVITKPFPHIPPNRPCIEDMTVEWYTRPETGCMLMGMGNSIANDLLPPFDNSILEPMINAAIHRIPVLENAGFLTGWTGIRPMTPDNLPLLSNVNEVKGLYVNAGWGGEGVMLSPVSGQLLAELITGTGPGNLDMSLLRLDRFGQDLDM